MNLLDRRIVARYSALFLLAIVIAGMFAGSAHAPWPQRLVGILVLLSVWAAAVLHITDRPRVWWRQLIAVPLNVFLAVALGLTPLLLAIFFVEGLESVLRDKDLLLLPVQLGGLSVVLAVLRLGGRRVLGQIQKRSRVTTGR